MVLKLVMVQRLVITGTASATGVELAGDGIGDVGQLLLLLLKVLGGGSGTVLIEPLGSLFNSVEKLQNC